MVGTCEIFSEFSSYYSYYFYYNSYINKTQWRFHTVLSTHLVTDKLILKTEKYKITFIPSSHSYSILKENGPITIKMNNLRKMICYRSGEDMKQGWQKAVV